MVLLAGALTGWATGLWWLLLPTVAVSLWLLRAGLVEAAGPFAWDEEDLTSLSGAPRRLAEAAQGAQRRLRQAMEVAPLSFRGTLRPVWLEVTSVGRRGVELAMQLQQVEALLAQLNPGGLERERSELLLLRDQSRDPHARARYDEALRSLQDRMRSAVELRQTAEQLDAQLRAQHQSLEALRGRVLRLSAPESGGAQQPIHALNEDLHRLTHGMEALAEAVREVHARQG